MIISGFFFLYDLDKLPLKLWDESRNAVNAFEMMQSGDLITRTYYGEPDMYELKPPMLIWIQQLTLRVFGLNEFALRLPSAMAGVLCSLLVFFFVKRQSNAWGGLLASLIFCSSLGVIGAHMFRYGDHDGLLVLFLLISMISTYELSKGKGGKWLWILPLSVLLAVFTKSIAGFLFLPAIAIWLVITGQLIRVLKQPSFILTSLFSAVCVILYYYLRETNSAGYWQAVWNNELFNRYLNTSPDAKYEELPWWYYIKALFDRFKPMFIFPFILIWRLIKGTTRLEQFLLLFFFSFLGILSLGSKNYWYDGPLYPILSILIAYQLYLILKSTSGLRKQLYVLSLLGGMVFILTEGVGQIMSLSIHKDKKELYAMSYFLRNSIQQNQRLDAEVVMQGFSHHLDFYVMVLNAKGSDIRLIKPFQMSAPASIIYSEISVQDVVNQRFTSRHMPEGNACWKAELIKENGYE